MPQKTFPASIDYLEQMLEFLNNSAVEIVSDTDKLFKIRLAAEEVLVNIIHYAYPKAAGDIRIDCSLLEGDTPGICIEIQDSGIPFNILKKQDPDITLPMEQREVGGLGIFLTRQIMDEIKYARNDGENVVKLIKYV